MKDARRRHIRKRHKSALGTYVRKVDIAPFPVGAPFRQHCPQEVSPVQDHSQNRSSAGLKGAEGVGVTRYIDGVLYLSRQESEDRILLKWVTGQTAVKCRVSRIHDISRERSNQSWNRQEWFDQVCQAGRVRPLHVGIHVNMELSPSRFAADPTTARSVASGVVKNRAREVPTNL
jgi:hypothetical protein